MRLFAVLIATAVLMLFLYLLSHSATTDSGVTPSVTEVTCYSGGQVIYQVRTTKTVYAGRQGQDWVSLREDSGDTTEVRGDCVVRSRR